MDVMGHGVPAALLSFSISRNLSPLAGSDSIVLKSGEQAPVSPVDVLTRLNTVYPFQASNNRFFTLLYGILDLRDSRFRYACGGHPGPLIFSSDGQIQDLTENSFTIGIVEEADFSESTIKLNPGDRMYLYSDGIIEETNEDEDQFEMSRLQESLKEGRSSTIQKSINQTVDAVISWHGSEHLSDDLSMIGIEMK